MAKQNINVGSSPNDRSGDSLRAAFQKINANFTELYTALGLDVAPLNLGAFEFSGSTLSTTDSSAITIDQATTVTSNLTVGGDLLPSVANGGDLGSAAKPWKSLYVSNSTIYLGGVPLSLDTGTNTLKVNNVPISQSITYADIPNAPTDVADLTDTTGLLGGGGGGGSSDKLVSGAKEVVLTGGANPYVTFPTVASGENIIIQGAEIASANGAVAITSSDSVVINTNALTALNTWTFGDDGNLDLPPGFINTNQVTGLNLRSGYDVHIISNHADVDREWVLDSYGDLTLPGGIKSEGAINIDINLSDSTLRRWTFTEGGDLRFPDGTSQSTAFTGGGITASSSDTFTNKTINIQAGQNNTFQIQGNSISSYSGSGAVVLLQSFPTLNAFNIGNGSNLTVDGGSGSYYWSGPTGVAQAGIDKAGVYRSSSSATNSLFTFAANGSGTMSAAVEGSLFIGTAMPSNNGGLNTDYSGWLVVQSGGKFGGDINTRGALIFDDALTGAVVFADGSRQTTAWDTGYLSFDDAALRGTSGYQYTFNTDGYFSGSTSSESTNYFFVTYNSTNLNIAAGWTVVGANCDTTVSSTVYPVGGYPGVIRVNLTIPASSTSGFYPVTVTSPDRLKVQIQPNPGTSNKYTFTTAGITFPDSTVQTTAWTGAGDIRGSVFADDSTMLVDGTGAKIVGPIETSSLRTSETKIALGADAGTVSQGTNAIAIGNLAGETSQGLRGVAVGFQAAGVNQGARAIAIGQSAGYNTQGANGIAIGESAGQGNQGADAIAIGRTAGVTNQSANSIILNASGSTLDAAAAGFFVNPIRNIDGSAFLNYNASTKEIGYSSDIRRETDFNIDINLADSTLRRWTFGEDGDLRLPGTLITNGYVKAVGPSDGIGNGDNLTVQAGETVTGDGGDLTVHAGDTVTGVGGDLTVRSGAATTGNAGVLNVRASDTVSGDGGMLNIRAGDAVTGDAGDIDIRAGDTITGDGGSITITAGSTVNSGPGGSVTITSGSNTNGAAGDISLVAATSSAGADGVINLTTAVGSWTFSETGNLTFPDTTVQSTAWTGSVAWSNVTSKPSFFSGSYNDLTDKPNLGGTYQFYVAADDSTQRLVSSDNVIKFIGAGGITTASDADGNITITGSGGGGGAALEEPFESKTSATGVVTHDCTTNRLFYHSSITASFTANFTNLGLAAGEATSVTLVLVQGVTARMCTAVQITGSAQTILWQGAASAPSGNASRTDVVTFSILCTATDTYTVLGMLTSFGGA